MTDTQTPLEARAASRALMWRGSLSLREIEKRSDLARVEIVERRSQPLEAAIAGNHVEVE